MCCSIRAAVFFLASVHVFFAVTQMVQIFPMAVAHIGDKLLESTMAFIFCTSYFATGIITFRGADEESATLIKFGSFGLMFVLIFRFVLMAFSIVLVKKIPEAAFLYVYGTQIVPIMFTVVLYLIYLSLLFSYHNELKHISNLAQLDSSTGFSNSKQLRHSQTKKDSIP